MCVMVYEIEGRIPHPYEVLSYPAGYIEQFFAFLQGIDFYADLGSNPAKKDHDNLVNKVIGRFRKTDEPG